MEDHTACPKGRCKEDTPDQTKRCGGCPCNCFSCDKVVGTQCACRRKMAKRYGKVINEFGRLKVGEKAPPFECEALLPNGTTRVVKLTDFQGLVSSKWVVLAFYCSDFSPVCATEVMALNKHLLAFHGIGTEVIGVSGDTTETHRAWTSIAPDHGGIGPIGFPLLADVSRSIALSYGAFRRATGGCGRVSVIIDNSGLVREIIQHPNGVGRLTSVLLRSVKGLQAVDKDGGLCPANWAPGDATFRKGQDVVVRFLKTAPN